MALAARLVAAVSTLSVFLPVVFAIPQAVTTTASPQVTASADPASSDTTAGVGFLNKGPPVTGTALSIYPSGVYNPNGPYSNPYDSSSQAFRWPGKPSKGQTHPPARPTPSYQPGGPAASKYHGPAYLPKGQEKLIPALSQSETNGNSPWGLLDNPYFPVNGSTSNSLLKARDNGASNATTSSAAGSAVTASPNSTVCGTMPDTGVTKSYNFQVSYQTVAPDGVTRNGLLVNGGFPGPLIEANWGDWIQVEVQNNLTDEGTTLHWHGLLQTSTPWYDGVPAVGQTPIAPGSTLTYLFRADMFGSSWYHSHYSAQYNGGALGPIVIHGPSTADYDIDVGPVMLSDWYHQDYFTLVNNTMNGIVPTSNNNLINGKMNYPCDSTSLPCTPNAGVSKFQFVSGKKHRLRLINTSAEGIQKFSIDNHTFTVIANDFVPINPYTTNVITLGVGQRSDVIVEATASPNSTFWMRSTLGQGSTGCSVTDGISPNAVAAVYYESADTNSSPNSTSDVTSTQISFCGNDPLDSTTAFCPVTPDPNPPSSTDIDIEFKSNGTNFVWFMNNSTFRANYNSPVLEDVNAGNLTFPTEWNVYNFGSNSSVRLIFRNFFAFGAHPIHIHGHNFHVLAEGFGDWDGTVVNPVNTQRRDVQLVQIAQSSEVPAYIVLQFQQDNPGVWPAHCHIAWHVSGGLYINVLERPDDIQAFTIPPAINDAATEWNAWTSVNVPDQIDSGL